MNYLPINLNSCDLALGSFIFKLKTMIDEIKISSMKTILSEFEFLPRLSEFCRIWNTFLGHSYPERNWAFRENTMLYHNLITQPLTKGMFVPCDVEGNVLVEPRCFHINRAMCSCDWQTCENEAKQFQQALDRVIFEGFKNYDTDIVMSPLVSLHLSEYKTIEDAINAGVKLTLVLMLAKN